MGKVWRYTERTLRDTLMRCAEHYGCRPPTVAEFEWWREREIEKAQGDRRPRRRASPKRDAVPAAVKDMGGRADALRVHA
jgi:hypothetical protein